MTRNTWDADYGLRENGFDGIGGAVAWAEQQVGESLSRSMQDNPAAWAKPAPAIRKPNYLLRAVRFVVWMLVLAFNVWLLGWSLVPLYWLFGIWVGTIVMPPWIGIRGQRVNEKAMYFLWFLVGIVVQALFYAWFMYMAG